MIVRHRRGGSPRGRLAALGTVAFATALSACGSGGGRPASVSTGPPTSASGGTPTSTTLPVAVHDQASAEALARNLLSRVVLPPGATSVPTPPDPALAQAPQAPATPDLADADRLATAPGTVTGTLAFFRAHVPTGFAPMGSGSGTNSRGATPMSYLTDAMSPVPAGVDESTVMVTVVPLSGARVGVRADAQVSWLPPKPAGWTVPARDRVATVSIVERSPTNPGVPPPQTVVVTDPATVTALAQAADGLPAAYPGTRSCPADLGTGYVVAFAPARGERADITFTAGSCDDVTASAPGRAPVGLGNDTAFSATYLRVLGRNP